MAKPNGAGMRKIGVWVGVVAVLSCAVFGGLWLFKPEPKFKVDDPTNRVIVETPPEWVRKKAAGGGVQWDAPSGESAFVAPHMAFGVLDFVAMREWCHKLLDNRQTDVPGFKIVSDEETRFAGHHALSYQTEYGKNPKFRQRVFFFIDTDVTTNEGELSEIAKSELPPHGAWVWEVSFAAPTDGWAKYEPAAKQMIASAKFEKGNWVP